MLFLVIYIIGFVISFIVLMRNMYSVENRLTIGDICISFGLSFTSWVVVLVLFLLYIFGKIDFDKVVYEKGGNKK